MLSTSLRLSPSSLETLSSLCQLTGESQSVLLARLIAESKVKDAREAFSPKDRKPVCLWITSEVEAKLHKMAGKLDCTQRSIIELLITESIDKKQ